MKSLCYSASWRFDNGKGWSRWMWIKNYIGECANYNKLKVMMEDISVYKKAAKAKNYKIQFRVYRHYFPVRIYPRGL